MTRAIAVRKMVLVAVDLVAFSGTTVVLMSRDNPHVVHWVKTARFEYQFEIVSLVCNSGNSLSGSG